MKISCTKVVFRSAKSRLFIVAVFSELGAFLHRPRRGRRLSRRETSPRGYVLLVVMAVSVLVITVLGTLAKVSLRRGLEAADAERSLQKRWGALTLERAMLANAAKVFEVQEELAKLTPGVPPPATIRAALTLRGVTFDLLLGDEDAKLNLNSFYHHIGQGEYPFIS